MYTTWQAKFFEIWEKRLIIWIERGNIFESKATVLVNPVNCKGIMGAGLAKEFKQRFPKNFEKYNKICKNGWLYPGDVYICWEDAKVIVNAATKYHYREYSDIEYIHRILKTLREAIINHVQENKEILVVAIPKLGCGLGDLIWAEVKPLFIKYLSDIDLTVIEVYE